MLMRTWRQVRMQRDHRCAVLGQVLGDGDLWKMDWYVPGVITQK